MIGLKLNRTKKTLTEVGFMLKKGLQNELSAQQHNATGRLSRGIKHHKKGLTLNMVSSVSYWKAVNDPKFAEKPNFQAIKTWVIRKGLPPTSAVPIFRKLKRNYGKPYVYWTQGNSLRRTNFAGYVANKFKKNVAQKLSPSIGADVADMIRKKLKQNNNDVIKAY